MIIVGKLYRISSRYSFCSIANPFYVIAKDVIEAVKYYEQICRLNGLRAADISSIDLITSNVDKAE